MGFSLVADRTRKAGSKMTMTRLLRMPGRRWVAALMLLLSAPLARGDDAADAASDLKRMQGEWVFQIEGTDVLWSLQGDTLKTTYNDIVFVSKLTLNAKDSPRHIDFFLKEGPNDVVGQTSLGIYKFDDDRVTFCVRRPGENGRPTEFKDIEDETFTFVIKKAK
jgi:uncharacterized protein (TIGR03067 family)